MRLPALCALVGASLVLASCAPQSAEGPGSAEPAADSMKVALLTPGPVSDAGWSAMAYDGLQAIKTDLGAEVSNQEALDAKIPDAMRSYAQDGFKLIIGHGFEYNEPAVEIAADYPETFFVSSSGSETAPNVGVIRFYLEQGFYVAGAAAALSSKTGKLAMIGGPDVPSIRSTFKAFKAGAEAARPGVEVIEVFTGDGQDVAKAKQAALTAIGQGADFLIHQANAAAQGVFDAAKEKGVSAFGANLNQNDNASGSVVGSAIIEAKPAFLSLAKRVQEGSYKGEVSLFGMKDGAIKMVWNEALADRITPDAKAKAEALIAEIEAGTLEVPKDEF